MGDWMTVRVVGTCPLDELNALRDEVRYDFNDLDGFGPLTATQGIANLGAWPDDRMDRSGNVAERDYGAEDVAKHLERLAKVAPGLALKVHCGGRYEREECVATVTLADGVATVGEPEIEKVEGATAMQMQQNFGAQMQSQGFGLPPSLRDALGI